MLVHIQKLQLSSVLIYLPFALIELHALTRLLVQVGGTLYTCDYRRLKFVNLLILVLSLQLVIVCVSVSRLKSVEKHVKLICLDNNSSFG